MRITFDQNTPLDEQFSRSMGRKQKGHKHNGAASPCRAKSHNSNIDKRLKSIKRKNALRKAYWRGELQEYPK